MKITDKVNEIMNFRPLSPEILKIAEDLLTSNDPISNQIIREILFDKYSDIRNWSWEELHGYTLDFGPHSVITLLTSCKDGNVITVLFNECANGKHQENVDQLLQKHGYVAISGNDEPIVIH